MTKEMEDLIFNFKAKEKLDNQKLVEEELQQGKSIKEIIQISDRLCRRLYQVAFHLFEEKNYKDAYNAFIFLSAIDPNCSQYWLGLGMSAQMCHDYETAIDAYELTACMEIDNPVPYFYLSKCLFAIHERENSLHALDLAIEVAGEVEDYQELKRQAEAAKKLLLEQFND